MAPRINSHQERSLRSTLHIGRTFGSASEPHPRLVILDDAPPDSGSLEKFRLEADDVRAAEGDSTVQIDPATRILVFCSVDTHVKTLAPVVRHFENVRILAPYLDDNRVREALEVEDLPWETHAASLEPFRWAQVGLVCSDWNHEDRWFVAQCRQAKTPSLCVQEGTNVDFGPYPYRMEWADAVCIQGPYSLKFLDRDLNFLTGNPRYDTYAPLPPTDRPTVMINCNFLYNMGHEQGREWVDLVIDAADALDLPYFVSVHPRDASDLRGIEPIVQSSAYSIQQQLEDCTVVVSRDSSVPYEALLYNRHAIYFNPFNEVERHLNEDDYGLIRRAHNSSELVDVLRDCLEATSPRNDASAEPVLSSYFGALDGRSHERVAQAITATADAGFDGMPDDGHRDALWKARAKVVFLRWARPSVRRVPALRALWRWIKSTAHPPGYKKNSSPHTK